MFTPATGQPPEYKNFLFVFFFFRKIIEDKSSIWQEPVLEVVLFGRTAVQ
jgi:hypothetical protein